MLRFQNLAESLPHLVWTCRSSDGACTYLSPQWTVYTGIPVEQQLGFAWLEQLHPDDAEATRAAWSLAARDGSVFDVEFRIRRHDGVYRWFKTRAVLARDATGESTWYGSNTDIQDLKDARAETEAANAALTARVVERTLELQRTQAESSALASELAQAQRVSQTGSWSFDLATQVVHWSDELFRIFGLEPAAAAVSYPDQARRYTPESFERLQQAVARAVETGAGYELTLQFIRVDGSAGVAVARGRAQRKDDGTVSSLLGTLQDVTEREQTAAALRQSTERLRLATQAARLGIWEWHVPTHGLVWDDGMYALYEVERDQFSGVVDAWERALHPDDAAATAAAVAAALERSNTFELNFRVVTPNQNVRHIRAFASVVRDEAGVVQRVTGVNQDVTQQRIAELALRKNLALQRAVLQHAGSAIIGTDTEGTITLWNTAAEEMLGWSADELIGHHSPTLIHDAAEIAARRAKLEADGHVVARPFDTFVVTALREGVDASEWTYVRKDGSRLPVLLTITALRDDANVVVGYLGVAVDLTQRKRVELELRELNRLLEERSAQKEVLLQEVHHRVKNNLQVIASLMNLQLRQLAEPSARLALAECRSRVQSIALIHEQLYTSRDYARVPLADYAGQLARNIVAASRDGDGVRLELDLQPVHLGVDKAIPCGLILNELITNALKHAFPEQRRGAVKVSLSRTTAEVSLTVADDGVGAFTPPQPGGRSLGLHLVNTLVRQLDGAVQVSHDHGTAFQITFPLAGE